VPEDTRPPAKFGLPEAAVVVVIIVVLAIVITFFGVGTYR